MRFLYYQILQEKLSYTEHSFLDKTKMKSKKTVSSELSRCSFGFRMWIYFCCALLNLLVILFMVTSKLIILLLMPIVWLSLFLEYLNLKLNMFILKQNLKV